MLANAGAEFNVVAKKFSGIVSRWGVHKLFEHPLYTWVQYSHKILRWLVPLFYSGRYCPLPHGGDVVDWL